MFFVFSLLHQVPVEKLDHQLHELFVLEIYHQLTIENINDLSLINNKDAKLISLQLIDMVLYGFVCLVLLKCLLVM